MAARWTGPAPSSPAVCSTSIPDTPITAQRLVMCCSPSPWAGGRSSFTFVGEGRALMARTSPAKTAKRNRRSQRHAAIFAVGEACFLQIEVALDPPTGLIGDLAVPQQRVDELPLLGDQFARQLPACHGDVVTVG